MTNTTNWTVSKWPFLLGDALLLAVAYFLIQHSPHPIDHWEVATVSACVALGAVLGATPFVLDYCAIVKVVEANALGSVAEKIQNLEKLAVQISSATNQWEAFQGIVQGNSEKTVAAAKGIADKMAAEVQQFSEFMQKMNDSEKATLRLEVDKLRRAELEWLHMLVRIFDHVFALHAAAARSGDPRFIEPITHFQNSCRGMMRRVGLTPFAAAPDEPFDPERHQIAGKEKPSADALVAETLDAGYTFQGKLLRPALVRVHAKKSIEESLETSAQEHFEEKLETVD